jgi:hypothetical protein
MHQVSGPVSEAHLKLRQDTAGDVGCRRVDASKQLLPHKSALNALAQALSRPLLRVLPLPPVLAQGLLIHAQLGHAYVSGPLLTLAYEASQIPEFVSVSLSVACLLRLRAGCQRPPPGPNRLGISCLFPSRALPFSLCWCGILVIGLSQETSACAHGLQSTFGIQLVSSAVANRKWALRMLA